MGMRNKNVQEVPGSKKIDTIIGKDTVVKGRIDSEGAIRIDGRFEGEIYTTSDLVVGEAGNITATRIEAKNICIAGEVHGNVVASGKLELVPSGKLYGDVQMSILVVEDGAVFQGQCEMLNPNPDVRERGKALSFKTPAKDEVAAAGKVEEKKDAPKNN